MIKKLVLGLTLACTVLLSSFVVYASQNNTPLTIETTANAGEGIDLGDEPMKPSPKIDQNVVPSSTISGSAWNTTWSQPSNMKYYKANLVNKASCGATIYVQSANGTINSKWVKSNGEDALYIKDAEVGTHTVWVTNDDGRIALKGTVTVKASTVSLAGK